MFEKDLIAIDINKETISILVGTRYKISNGTIIETPRDSFDNGRILDVNLISAAVTPHIKKAKTKDVAFVVRGEDIITRHLNIPFAKDEAMRDSVDFELRQFMGDRVDEYYFDYQIINQNKNDGTGKCDVLVVACSRDKIDAFMELGKTLRLNVKAIDLYANVIARVFGDLRKSTTKGIKTIGVIGIDSDDSNITILEWGKLILEKYKDSGILSTVDKEFTNLTEYNSLLDTVDLIEPKQPGEESDIELYFKDEANDYNSLIQYYTSGKVKKNLDRIYVMGSATRIKGIEQYFEVSLSARAAKLPMFSDLKTSVKAPKKVKLKDYIMCYGLLLRRD
ncbi:hypothetical protein [Clostridium paraputrificum]|uniref:Competence protein A n=1 Tax=Clostridium paraputrificum TaxID=29363 RepID=A0A6N3CWM8_9CLOT